MVRDVEKFWFKKVREVARERRFGGS